MASTQQKKDFINLIGIAAVKVCKERGYGNAQVWTCIAQACCESNYGQSNLMKRANAFLGIKATTGWIRQAKYGGLVYDTLTKECYDGKNYVVIRDLFRAYRTAEDCVRDYFDLLSLARYQKSLTKKTVREAITEIKNGGYATDPTYIDTICKFYNSNKTDIEQYRVDLVEKVETVQTRSTIREGSSGSDVVYLKKRLTSMGFGNLSLENDRFTKGVGDAVQYYQLTHGLIPDRICGAKTWASIEGQK